MKHKRRWLAAAVVTMALPAPAAAADLCTALNRIVAASREAVPFASLREAALGGTLVPGFREQDCAVRPGIGIACYRNIAPANLERGAMERALRECLGVAPVPGPERRWRGEREPALAFVASGLRYEVTTGCDHSCRAGLLAYFDVMFEGERRPSR